jgi:probable blue pigment (indigoidine) exporter
MMTMETSAGAASHRTTALVTLAAPVSWGTTYLVAAKLLPDSQPMFVAAMRVLPAGLLLLLLGRRTSAWRPSGAEWGRTAVLAACNFGIFFPLLFGAVYRLPGGVAASAGGVLPILVALLSWLVVGRRPRPAELAVGAVAAFGVALVVIRPGAGLDPVGVVMALGANVSFAFGVVFTKRFPTPPNRLAATGWQLSVAGAALLVLALGSGAAPTGVSVPNVVGFAYLAVVATAVAYVLWFDGIRKLPAAAPPLLGLAAPVTGAALGWLVLGQSLSPVQVFGFALTIAAIARGATLPEAGHPVRSQPWPVRAASRTPATRTAGAAGSATSPSIPTCR